jgi:hypothetical protein
MLMTWGFYGMLLSAYKLSACTDLDRLRKSKWCKRRLKSIDDYCGNIKCWAELLLVLPTADCLHGIWCCKAESWQDYDTRALAGSSAFRIWLDLFDSKLDYHA